MSLYKFIVERNILNKNIYILKVNNTATKYPEL